VMATAIAHYSVRSAHLSARSPVSGFKSWRACDLGKPKAPI
jgi:hypothetical protein